MRIYIFIFLVISTIQSLKADIVEYVFLEWDCSEIFSLEEKKVTAETRFEKQFQFHFENPLSVSMTNEIYIPLSVCENSYFQTLTMPNAKLLEISQGVERKQRKMQLSILRIKVTIFL